MTASPKSAMTQVPSPGTSTFFDLMSRCAIAGFPYNTIHGATQYGMIWCGMLFVGVYFVDLSMVGDGRVG